MSASAPSPALEIARLLPDGFSATGDRRLDLDRHLNTETTTEPEEISPPLDLPDGGFDLIFSLSALSRISGGWGEWLPEIHRLLADDGLLIAALPVAPERGGGLGESSRGWIALRKHRHGEAASSRPEASDLGEGLGELLQHLDARHRNEVDAVREGFQRELMRKSFRIAELELGETPTPGSWAIAERVSAEYEATLSWRVTRPLRAAKRIFSRR